MDYAIDATTNVTFKMDDGNLRCDIRRAEPPYEGFTLAAGSYSYSTLQYDSLSIYKKDGTLFAFFKCDSADTAFRVHAALTGAVREVEEPSVELLEQLEAAERAYEDMLAKEAAECEDDGYGACGYKCDGRCQECGSGGFDMADEI